MPKEKAPGSGSTTMLVLALLKNREMYGYEIIEELERRSNQVFKLKEGTLYPILHGLERDKLVTARQAEAPSGRVRRYYRITKEGLRVLDEKKAEWAVFSGAVMAVLAGT